MKHIIKPALSLFLIAAVCTIALGLVRNITLEPIENQRKRVQENTMKAILPEASDFTELSIEKNGSIGSIQRVFEGRAGNEVVGYVIELAPEGYSGAITMMVGISKAKNEITGMRILRHTETPGLGALATNEEFYSQYDNRNLIPLRVARSSPGENDIEAITGATITTRAVTNAVNEAIAWYNEAGVK